MTIHLMDNGLDTGDIIYQSKVPVLPGDTIATLYDRIWDSSETLVPKLLKSLDTGEIPRKPQDMSKYFYNYEISEKDFELDFRQPANTLYGRVKMMPGKFYYIYNGKKHYVEDCSIVKEPKKNRKYIFRTPIDDNGKIFFLTPRNYLKIEKISEIR
jgi:methionyl-tRNA formyltransferase